MNKSIAQQLLRAKAYQPTADLTSTYVLDIEVDNHVASIEVTWGQHVGSSTIIAGLRNKNSLPIVAPQIAHNAGLAPVPYTGQNSPRKFLPSGGIRISTRPIVQSQGMMP